MSTKYPTTRSPLSPFQSLGFWLMGGFVLLVVTGSTAWLTWYRAQSLVQLRSTELQRVIEGQVLQTLTPFLAAPLLANQLNADAIRLEELSALNPIDPLRLERHFWQQIQRFPDVSTIRIANQQGGMLGAGRLNDGTIVLYQTHQFAKGEFFRYQLNAQGEPTRRTTISSTYDAVTRPWYQKAVRSKQAGWSDIYPLVSDPSLLSIAATQPFFDAQGTLQGVLVSDLVLVQVDRFLKEIQSPLAGELFIVERSGLLVSTSTGDPLVRPNAQNVLERVPATDSNQILTRTAARLLVQTFGNFQSIQGGQDLTFEENRNPYTLRVTPFQDRYGLDWLVVNVRPVWDRQQPTMVDWTIPLGISIGAMLILRMGIAARNRFSPREGHTN